MRIIKLMLVIFAVVLVMIGLTYTFKGKSEVCAYPTGRLGDMQRNYYTLRDGRDVSAICTEAGWTARND